MTPRTQFKLSNQLSLPQQDNLKEKGKISRNNLGHYLLASAPYDKYLPCQFSPHEFSSLECDSHYLIDSKQLLWQPGNLTSRYIADFKKLCWSLIQESWPSKIILLISSLMLCLFPEVRQSDQQIVINCLTLTFLVSLIAEIIPSIIESSVTCKVPLLLAM